MKPGDETLVKITGSNHPVRRALICSESRDTHCWRIVFLDRLGKRTKHGRTVQNYHKSFCRPVTVQADHPPSFQSNPVGSA